MAIQKDINIRNKRASFDYEFLAEEIAGISLMGSEIKSIREGDASIKEAHCYIQDREMWITGMHIAEYKQAGGRGHEPLRKRKLLVTKKQIDKWDKELKVQGKTIVPVSLFINKKGIAKLKIALAKGKKKFDKRDSLKEKDVKRDMDREIKG
jgi:SsrA-binding protein